MLGFLYFKPLEPRLLRFLIFLELIFSPLGFLYRIFSFLSYLSCIDRAFHHVQIRIIFILQLFVREGEVFYTILLFRLSVAFFVFAELAQLGFGIFTLLGCALDNNVCMSSPSDQG